MKNFNQYITSGFVIANKSFPENVKNGGLLVFHLIKTKEISSDLPLVTPILKLNRNESNDYTFLARCLGWQENNILSTKLGVQEDVLLTPVLDGCTFAVYKDKETQELIACHANFVVEDMEYAYFKDGFVDYNLYETNTDGQLLIYSQEVLNNEDPEDFEELAPIENQEVYIKHIDGAYEKKIYIDSRTLNQSRSGSAFQKKIDYKLQERFPSQK